MKAGRPSPGVLTSAKTGVWSVHPATGREAKRREHNSERATRKAGSRGRRGVRHQGIGRECAGREADSGEGYRFAFGAEVRREVCAEVRCEVCAEARREVCAEVRREVCAEARREVCAEVRREVGTDVRRRG